MTRLVALLAVALAALPAPARAVRRAGGLDLEIRTVVTSRGAREALSVAHVRVPPSAEVRVGAEEGGHTIAARFHARAEGEAVRIAARVETRRAAGTSARGLPLTEEDVQSQTARLPGDASEALVVFPFGRDGSGEELAIEIVPALARGPVETPAIQIDKPGPGWIRIDAEVMPYSFEIDAELAVGGLAVARGAASVASPGEPARVLLSGPGPAAADLSVTVDRSLGACPAGGVALSFDLDRVAADGSATPVARGWSGVTRGPAPLEYPIEDWPREWPGPATLRIRCRPGSDPAGGTQ